MMLENSSTPNRRGGRYMAGRVTVQQIPLIPLGMFILVLFSPSSGESQGQPLPPGMTMTCTFSSGPNQGKTINFAGVPGARAGFIGAPCSDGQGSQGVGVAPQASSVAPATSPTTTPTTTSSATNTPLSPGTTLTCRFSSGPNQGKTINFAGVPGATPGFIGAPCGDGQGSQGVGVAPQ
jgi:hypothetical protein